MNIKPIITDQDYCAALKRIEELWGSNPNTPQGDEFDLLCTQVESYEMTHFPIEPPESMDVKDSFN